MGFDETNYFDWIIMSNDEDSGLKHSYLVIQVKEKHNYVTPFCQGAISEYQYPNGNREGPEQESTQEFTHYQLGYLVLSSQRSSISAISSNDAFSWSFK